MAISLFWIVGLLCLLILEWVTGWMGMNIIIQTFLTACLIMAGLLFILIELPIVVALTIDTNKIVVKNLLTRKKKEFLLKNADRFKISSQIGIKGGFYLDLILLRHGEALESIPLRYIYNLDQIVKALETQWQNMTEDEYGIIRDLRDQSNN